MNMYAHLTIKDFHALSENERLDLSKSEVPLVVTLEKAEKELIKDVGANAMAWLGGKDRLALDCRRIVDGQKWKVPILTSDFLPKILILAPWRFEKRQFMHLFTYLCEEQFYHWDAVNLSYNEAHRLVFTHSTYFHHGMVSVTDFCNLKCRMCSYHGEDPRYAFSQTRKKRKKMELADEDYYAYIDQLPEGKDLLFCGTGELFVAKNKWRPYLRYAQEKGCHVRILTNGMLLTPDIARELVGLGVGAVIFSVDGHRADLVEDIRLGTNFDTILNNIRNLINLRDEHGSGMVINVHCSILEMLQPFQDEMHDFWKEFGVDGLSFFPEWTDWDTSTTISFSEDKPPMSYPCWNALLAPVLLTNGLVSPCTGHLQGEWGTVWDTDWLQKLRPDGLEAAVRAYRHYRLDAASAYRKNCSKCTGKMSCYVAADGNLTHCQSYSFTHRHTLGEAAFVRQEQADEKRKDSLVTRLLSLVKRK
ncbi:MAG: radical SAM protein [Desulfobulbaceae bacterium]|nr:radical SAM protein [Desulfobulbaceae bacterium]